MTVAGFSHVGKIYDRLTVIAELPRYAGPSGVSLRKWQCRCSCGNLVEKFSSQLCGSKFERSCGCSRAGRLGRPPIHGSAAGNNRTSEYVAWNGMRQRCSMKEGNRDYPYWAGRGIKVCERWNDYAAFIADMGPKPGASYSIDRIDVDGNYEPSNCRWATPTEQSRNRRSMGGNRRRA